MKRTEREQRNKEIILLYETGNYTQEQLAIKYNLSIRAIKTITKGHKPFSYRDESQKVPLDIDKLPVDEQGNIWLRVRSGAKRKGQVWSTKNWGSGPPGGIKDSMIHYQDAHYNGSFYDEDDFWKFTI
jgi:hypothetical protein